MISENQYLIPLSRKKEMEDEHNYIITAIEIAAEDDDDRKKIEGQFSEIMSELQEFVKFFIVYPFRRKTSWKRTRILKKR
jgi:hypothetical protein